MCCWVTSGSSTPGGGQRTVSSSPWTEECCAAPHSPTIQSGMDNSCWLPLSDRGSLSLSSSRLPALHLCVCITHSLTFHIAISLSLYPCCLLSISLSLTLSHAFSPSLSLSLSLSVCLSLSLSPSLTLSVLPHWLLSVSLALLHSLMLPSLCLALD